MIILDFFNFIIGIILIFVTIAIFHPINRYKKLKSKEDQLFMQKTFITLLFFILILIITILSVLKIMNDPDTLFIIQVLLFNCYIINISLYNLCMSYELFNTYKNPVHFFNRLLKQQKHNYIQEFFIFIITIVVLGVDIFFYKKDKYDDIKDHIKNNDNKDNDIIKFYCNDSSIFIIIGKWKPFLLLLISLIGIIYCLRAKSIINKFCFKYQDKLLNFISKRTISNYLYLVYSLFYGLPVISDTKQKEFFNVFGSIFFMIVILLDYIVHLTIIASSKFCEYRLRKTLLGYLCSCFIKIPKYQGTGNNAPLVYESSINETTGLSTYQNETTTTLDIIANNANDKELVTTYKNGIFMEDYFVGYFDQILNIISSSMFKVYNSKYFSSQANEKILSSSIKIGVDMSSIGGSMQNLTTSNLGNNKTALSSNSELGDEIARFDIIKNMERDDLNRFREVLESGININNNNHFLNISIKSFFTSRCVESIYDQRLKGNKIANSLLSHLILNNTLKNKSIAYPNSNFWSLLSSNGKEEYFSSLKNTSIKTFDKNFTLDIFDSNDDEIVFNENKNKNCDISNLLDKYFAYVHGKGVNGTFIPSLLGVFKIKINNFKTLLIFITKNSLVENAPKSFYTYWQLIRFLNEKPQKIASSKFNSGSLVKDDPIFERSFQIENKKDNPNYNKIFVKNYSEFIDTVKNDIRFIKEIGSKNFDLLLMYYEFENTQKHEKQGKIKILQTNKGAEFIEESLPKGPLFDEDIAGSSINNLNNNFAKTPESIEAGNFLSMEGGFLDDNVFGGKNSNLKKSGNLLDIEEKININGIDGVFDSFNCLCFFTFENIFDLRKRFSSSNNYYDNFQNKVLVNFTEFKK